MKAGLNSLHAWKLFMLLLSSADVNKVKSLKKFFQEHYQSKVISRQKSCC